MKKLRILLIFGIIISSCEEEPSAEEVFDSIIHSTSNVLIRSTGVNGKGPCYSRSLEGNKDG